ncbi:hypothetical protein LINGRAHAP2_LOCUS35987 [Linum grandiflorum]
MENIHIILNHSIPSLEIKPVSLRLSVPSSKPENPTPSDHRHLPHSGERTVPPQNAQIAAVVLPFLESKIQHHQETELALGRGSVDPLGPAHELRAWVGPYCQRVVHHDHQPEGRARGVGRLRSGHGDCGRVGPADDVVEVEFEVGELFFSEAEFFRVEGFGEGGVGEGDCDEEGEEEEFGRHGN